MTSKRNVVYTIQIVGRLWLPAQKVAMDMEIHERDWNVIDSDFQNLTLDEIEHYVMTHTGDLSQIIDFTVDKHEEKGLEVWIDDEGWNKSTRTYRTICMKDWETEDSQILYLDCMSQYAY